MSRWSYRITKRPPSARIPRKPSSHHSIDAPMAMIRRIGRSRGSPNASVQISTPFAWIIRSATPPPTPPPYPKRTRVCASPRAALVEDDDQERRVRLLLLGKGAVLAHQFERPLAAGMDEYEQRLIGDADDCSAWKAIAAARLLLFTDAGAGVGADRGGRRLVFVPCGRLASGDGDACIALKGRSEHWPVHRITPSGSTTQIGCAAVSNTAPRNPPH